MPTPTDASGQGSVIDDGSLTPTPTPSRLIEDYVAYLQVKKGRARSPGHVREVFHRITRMFAGLSRLEQLTSDEIEARLHELLQERIKLKTGAWGHRSTVTVDGYRRELGTFFRWVVKKRRLLLANPVDRVDAFEPEDQRDLSRPFTPAEVADFFAHVPQERVLVYLFWATSGLRPGETRRLVWAHVVFEPVDGGAPYVQILRSTSKNRKAIPQPLHPDVVTLLRPLRGLDDEPVFRVVPACKVFAADLRRAGLTRATAEGRLSRTSLRKFFATSLQRTGATLVEAQGLMRHSTPVLTANVYTRHSMAEKAARVSGLDVLPEWRRPGA